MNHEGKEVVNKIEKQVGKELRKISKLLREKVDTRVDSEGDYYWVAKSKISNDLIGQCEDILNDCARIYRNANQSNLSEKYHLFSRMVANVRIDFVPSLPRHVNVETTREITQEILDTGGSHPDLWGTDEVETE